MQRIGGRYFSGNAGAVAATIFLLNPTTFTISLIIHSEILFVFLYLALFLVLAWSLERNMWAVAVAGGIILKRENGRD
jgi:4-amino-4-deoxy-L-arabinose transferase-like glycosyltransferase